MKRVSTQSMHAGAIALTAAVVLNLISGCDRPAGFQQPPPPQVTGAKPLKQTVTVFNIFTGETSPFDTVDIVARVPGYLEQMHFEEGRYVEKGQLLYTLEKDQYQAALEQAQADVSAARADYQAALTKYELIKEAYEQQAASRKELIEAQAARDQTFAQIAVAESSVIQAKLNLSYTEIRSPIAGQINQTLIDPGNYVGETTTKLTDVVQFDPIYIYFTVNQRELLQYLATHPKAANKAHKRDASQPILIQTATGKTYPEPALIDFAQNVADESTGTITLRAIVSNPERQLYPGIFIRVKAPQKSEDAILVPGAALQRDMEGSYLMVVEQLSDDAKKEAADTLKKMQDAAAGTPRAEKLDKLKPATQTVRRVNVTLGATVGDMQIIESGITENDVVVVNGLPKARPGAPLYVEMTTLEMPKNVDITMPKSDKTLADFPSKRKQQPARQSKPVGVPELDMTPPKDQYHLEADDGKSVPDNNDTTPGTASGS